MLFLKILAFYQAHIIYAIQNFSSRHLCMLDAIVSKNIVYFRLLGKVKFPKDYLVKPFLAGNSRKFIYLCFNVKCNELLQLIFRRKYTMLLLNF